MAAPISAVMNSSGETIVAMLSLEALGYYSDARGSQQYPAPLYDPFTVLAWLAGTTERIGLGTTVTVLPADETSYRIALR